jgi:hypothetical protein
LGGRDAAAIVLAFMFALAPSRARARLFWLNRNRTAAALSAAALAAALSAAALLAAALLAAALLAAALLAAALLAAALLAAALLAAALLAAALLAAALVLALAPSRARARLFLLICAGRAAAGGLVDFWTAGLVATAFFVCSRAAGLVCSFAACGFAF